MLALSYCVSHKDHTTPPPSIHSPTLMTLVKWSSGRHHRSTEGTHTEGREEVFVCLFVYFIAMFWVDFL